MPLINLRHCWKKEKMLVTSLFSFSPQCFQKLSSETVVKILGSIHALTLYQTTKFLDWTKLKAFADDKMKVLETIIFVFERLPAFSPFPSVLSKGFLHWVVKSRDCVVLGILFECLCARHFGTQM